MATVLVMVTVAVKKHHDQSKSGRKAFIQFTLLHHNPSSKEFKTETQREQEPVVRS